MNGIMLKPGMALYAQRAMGYKHYGIYAEIWGVPCVIHYNGKLLKSSGRIEITTINKFTMNDAWGIEKFDGISYSDAVCRESIGRATLRLYERQYHPIFNNCEHFTTWCVTGQHKSNQVTGVFTAVLFLSAAMFARTVSQRVPS